MSTSKAAPQTASKEEVRELMRAAPRTLSKEEVRELMRQGEQAGKEIAAKFRRMERSEYEIQQERLDKLSTENAFLRQELKDTRREVETWRRAFLRKIK